MNQDEVRLLLERLAGQPAPFPTSSIPVQLFGDGGAQLGYSQLNELLLLFGFDRISQSFFSYLLSGTTKYVLGSGFNSAEQLRQGIDRFRKIAILSYGNVKFAFKTMSRYKDQLDDLLVSLEPPEENSFSLRHLPVLPLKLIAPADAYLTGYLIEKELTERLARHPTDESAVALETRRQQVVEDARFNQSAYLASDHLDVYVATSMRERHEFSAISRLTKQIFDEPALSVLRLRWFDPTQAYCPDRIDKGLSEALMLRRATCTIYLAQESDTLGKDSELASTLAQGKPVIAFIPEVSPEYVQTHIRDLQEANPDSPESQLLLDQLRIFEPDAAWRDPKVRDWCGDSASVDLERLRSRVAASIKKRYDSRASTLRDSHPLGIQVNLDTGVANGVLVVRSVECCAELVRRIVTQSLEFTMEENSTHTALRESVSGCIFRVITHDQMLTNTFWNFYVDPAE